MNQNVNVKPVSMKKKLTNNNINKIQPTAYITTNDLYDKVCMLEYIKKCIECNDNLPNSFQKQYVQMMLYSLYDYIDNEYHPEKEIFKNGKVQSSK